MTESATLEGTYHQESHSYFRKDTQLKDNSNQKFVVESIKKLD